MAFLVKISGTDVSFPAEKGERILDAAERAGYDIPHAITNTCGSLRYGRNQKILQGLPPYLRCK